jgi:DtxR family Mn-dependent transcriptional regulator
LAESKQDVTIQESGEMYLETILILSKTSNEVRSLDVAEYMGFSKPSVSRAVGILKDGGFVVTDHSGFLFLTDKGQELAETIYERHTLLSKWLMNLGVEEKVAVEDACKIEHDISEESFEAIKQFVINYREEKEID